MKLIKKSDQVITPDTDKTAQMGSGMSARLSGWSMNRRRLPAQFQFSGRWCSTDHDV